MSETKNEHRETTIRESASIQKGQQKQPLTRQNLTNRWFEALTAIMLGVVAVATAWSGYQSTRWDGEQSTRYAQANVLRVESIRNSNQARQLSLYDTSLFNDWLNAYSRGDTKLAGTYEKRFRPEFQPAFEAWLATNPFNNSNAPPGPLLMPQYKVSLAEKADQLAIESDRNFEKGQAANDQSDEYVLNTVFLATVLFLTAIAERFRWNWVRAVILVFALVMLLFGIYHLAIYPII
jgi:hypothetical protein